MSAQCLRPSPQRQVPTTAIETAALTEDSETQQHFVLRLRQHALAVADVEHLQRCTQTLDPKAPFFTSASFGRSSLRHDRKVRPRWIRKRAFTSEHRTRPDRTCCRRFAGQCDTSAGRRLTSFRNAKRCALPCSTASGRPSGARSGTSGRRNEFPVQPARNVGLEHLTPHRDSHRKRETAVWPSLVLITTDASGIRCRCQ